MKIIQLTAENVKRLHAVNIKPDGSMIQITGENGQGKSSVLDAIMYGLAGKQVQPSKPIRDGESHAEVMIDLGDKIVRRRWTKKDSYLTVESKDGAKYPSPQKILDALVGELTFDPLAFIAMHPKEQIATLKQLAGLDFAEMDIERDTLTTKRTARGHERNTFVAQVSGIPIYGDDVPDKQINIIDLLAEQTKRQAEKQANDEVRRKIARAAEQVNLLESEIAHLKDMIAEREQTHGETYRNLVAAQALDKTLLDPNLDEINEQLINAQQINDRVSKKQQRAALSKRRDEAAAGYERLTAELKKIDERKAASIRDASYPVQGLGFDENGVTFNGVPFDQASSAEQLRVSVAMGIALNPELRIMLIRNGSLLDKKNLETISEMVAEHDTQLWIERVNDGEPVGILIKDGYAYGDQALPVETETEPAS